jgi:hypothetical protein
MDGGFGQRLAVPLFGILTVFNAQDHIIQISLLGGGE